MHHENKVIQVVVDLKNAYETQGESIIKTFEKNISLAIIDETWKTHLKKMDDLKQSVQSAVYEQKDPLIIYKMEAYHLFKRMLVNLNKEISKKNIKNDLHDDFKKYSKKQLTKKIENAIEAENYELAARLRDEINSRK